MGIPEIVWELKVFPKHRKGKDFFIFIPFQIVKTVFLVLLVIISAYLSGIAAFIYTLQKWTQTRGNLYWPLTE